MDYIVESNARLCGELQVYGAKNCALALLGATVLTDEEVILHNCPDIVDVGNMLKLLESMGKTVWREGDNVGIKGRLTTTSAPKSYAVLLRGSALVLGSTLARYGKVELPLPGGCAIGARPMDIHLQGLEKLGAEVECEDGTVRCSERLRGGKFRLRFASVGATENLLCACAVSSGVSLIENCALEPEVVALEQMLVKMGAQIDGVGRPKIYIEGVRKLKGVEFDIIPDRIVAATYLSAVAASGGDVVVNNCEPIHMTSFLNVLKSRFDIRIYQKAARIIAKNQPIGYGKIITAPFPYFPTDMQSLVMSLAAFSNGGKTKIVERLFESRLEHNAKELNKMGADIKIKGNAANIIGCRLHGANVRANDLRGGAGLLIAGLNAKGVTKISGVEHINRGYDRLAENLNSVGARIRIDP